MRDEIAAFVAERAERRQDSNSTALASVIDQYRAGSDPDSWVLTELERQQAVLIERMSADLGLLQGKVRTYEQAMPRIRAAGESMQRKIIALWVGIAFLAVFILALVFTRGW